MTAIEPSAEMAALARVKLARWPGVTIVQSAFEPWEPSERFDAMVSVQAWHWVEPAVRYARARQALAAGAMLAAVWSFPDWERCSERDALSRAYRNAAVKLQADFPMHPDSEPTRLSGRLGRRDRRRQRFRRGRGPPFPVV